MLLDTISTASETLSLLEKRTNRGNGGGRGGRGEVAEQEDEGEGRKRVEEEGDKGGAGRGGGGGQKEEERGSKVDQMTLSLPTEVERNMRGVEDGKELSLGQRRSSQDNRNVSHVYSSVLLVYTCLCMCMCGTCVYMCLSM